MTEQAKVLWQEMADLTLAKCKESCRTNVGSCCSPEYCALAAEAMRKAGYAFHKFQEEGKTFVVDGKCIVPPHFRPLCSLHQCKISGLGFDPKDPEWTKKYFKLRKRLEKCWA